MKVRLFLLAAGALLTQGHAHAINAAYARQLERSGCTQVSEAQGCDIRKSKAENAKAGFGPAGVASGAGSGGAPSSQTPYAGRWVAKSDAGAQVAAIHIDARERVWVDGKRVKAKRSDGALVFSDGNRHYVIQGDRRLQGENGWTDHQSGTHGPILVD